jgi:hypothetical protein
MHFFFQKSGVYRSSIVSSLLQELSSKETPSQEAEDIIRNAAGTVYAGGADTVCLILETKMGNHMMLS